MTTSRKACATRSAASTEQNLEPTRTWIRANRRRTPYRLGFPGPGRPMTLTPRGRGTRRGRTSKFVEAVEVVAVFCVSVSLFLVVLAEAVLSLWPRSSKLLSADCALIRFMFGADLACGATELPETGSTPGDSRLMIPNGLCGDGRFLEVETENSLFLDVWCRDCRSAAAVATCFFVFVGSYQLVICIFFYSACKVLRTNHLGDGDASGRSNQQSPTMPVALLHALRSWLFVPRRTSALRRASRTGSPEPWFTGSRWMSGLSQAKGEQQRQAGRQASRWKLCVPPVEWIASLGHVPKRHEPQTAPGKARKRQEEAM